MSATLRYPAWLWLCLGYPMLATAQPAPPPGWQVTDPAPREGLSPRRHVPLMTQEGRQVQVAYLLVGAPLETVIPAVEAALKPLGRFDTDHHESPQAYMREGWDAVLMSRHPALRIEYARRFHQPALEQQVSIGALLPHELTREMARLEASDQSVPQLRIQIPALQRTYASWDARQTRHYGLTRRTHTTDTVSVQQMDGVFGAPATVVSVTRETVWPNPDGGLIDQFRNMNFIGGGAPPRYLRWQLVPADSFNAVHAALSALPDVAAPDVQHTPLAWVVPIPPAATVREPTLHVAPADATHTARTLWHTEDYKVSLRAMLPLPDGSLLLHQGGNETVLWRLTPDGELTEIWRHPEERYNSRGRLLLDRTRDNAYLAFSDGILIYRLRDGQVTRHPLQFAEHTSPPEHGLWRAGAEGLPVLFDHHYSYREEPNTALRQFRPGTVPTADGEPWLFSLAFLSPRQLVAHKYLRGNSQLQPLDALADQGTWVEEPTGLALLDAEDGHVLRAISLPRRLGNADPYDDTGMVQSPAAFGSVAGGWMATGFALSGPPSRASARYGMHVTDIATGRTQLSATIDNLRQLRAAAGSPDGRWLALGGPMESSGVTHLGIWETDSGEARLIDTEERACRDLQQLTWSLDGQRLWVLCQRSLLVWEAD